MRIFPAAEVKPLSECEPGQLVRGLEYRDDGCCGIVFDAVDSTRNLRGVVFLRQNSPQYEVDDFPEDYYVLCYSDEILVEVNQNGSHQNRHDQLMEMSGVIVFTKEGPLLNVESNGGHFPYRNRKQLNLKSGILAPHRGHQGKAMVFGSWTLSLLDLSHTSNRVTQMVSYNKDAKIG